MQAVKLTPKKVAQAIGVSESSMKRWCDRGLIDFHTTAGGHRRISRASVIDFLRHNRNHSLIRSELLGLPDGISPGMQSIEGARTDYKNAVLDCNEMAAQRLLFGLYLAGHSIADIGDQVIAPSFQEIGLKWECGNLEIYRERRACEITVRLLSDLRALLPEPRAEAPLAIGGAPESDSYSLPTTLVEMVFRENGWRAQSLGSLLPLETLAAAGREQQPRVFWMSISVIGNEPEFVRRFNEFQGSLSPDTFLVVGGNALSETVRQQISFSAYGDNLRQLQSLAVSLTANG